MNAYLGQLGRLVPIYSNPSMEVSGIPARTFQTTLEGRVKAQVRPVGRRSWTLSAAYASPGEVAALLDFATGVWGNGPFAWVPPTAPAINMLAPDVASCGLEAIRTSNASMAGPLLLPDGSWAGRSLLNSDTSELMFFGPGTIPVVAGGTVTASAYVVGAGAKCAVQFRDSAGEFVSSKYSTQSGVAGSSIRLSVTAEVPPNAVSCAVFGANTIRGARPALTWTDHANEWGPGEGCSKAIVEAVSREALTGSTDVRGRRDSNISFTIREVG